MTLLIEQARVLAEAAHHGVANKNSGEPYIRHPERVANYVRLTSRWMDLPAKETELSIAIAWLHDTVEDTWVTAEILNAQFPPEVSYGVLVLTRHREVPEETYYQRIANYPVAKAVKWADLLDNTDPLRLSAVSESRAKHFTAKYDRGAACLNIPSPTQWWQSQAGRARSSLTP